MARRRYDPTLDVTPRVPSSATSDDVASRAVQERQLARTALVLLVPVFAATFVSFAHDLDFTLVARALEVDPDSVGPARIMALDARSETVLFIPLIASLPFMVVFLVWLHRAFHNAHWLGAGRWMAFSPAEAVLSFFVPLRNFVRPLQAFHELARASEPADLEEPPRATDSTAGYRDPALSPAEASGSFRVPPLGAWWATWLGAHLVGFLGTRLTHSVDVSVAVAGGWVLLASDAIQLAAAVLVGVVVHAIDRRRVELYRRLLGQAPVLSPQIGGDEPAHEV